MYASLITTLQDFFYSNIPHVAITWGEALGSLGILLFSYALRKYIVEGFLMIMGRLAEKTDTEVDDLLLEVIRVPLRVTVVYFGILAAIAILPMERYPRGEETIYTLFRLGAVVILTWTAIRSIKVVTYLLKRITSRSDTLIDDKLVPFVDQILRILFIVIGVVMFMQELGYNPSGLLAGLGLGGLAFALAAKDTLSNFFGSIMLLTDKPFSVGDWIKVTDAEGTVEQIGFRSTQIRLFDKSLVQVPNGKLASEAIRNFNRRDRRRIYFHVGVTYSTTPLMMKTAIAITKKLIEDHEGIRNDFYLVNFNEFKDSSLSIMIYCFTTTVVWGEYLDIQQDLMMSIMEQFEEAGISMAFPTMTVHMGQDTPPDIEAKARIMLDKLGADLDHETTYRRASEPLDLDADGGGEG